MSTQDIFLCNRFYAFRGAPPRALPRPQTRLQRVLTFASTIGNGYCHASSMSLVGRVAPDDLLTFLRRLTDREQTYGTGRLNNAAGPGVSKRSASRLLFPEAEERASRVASDLTIAIRCYFSGGS